MAQIKPFKAVYYNKEKCQNLADVVCPPYDVISKKQQDKYSAASPYNFVHILLGKDLPKDDQVENKYSRAKKTFEKWLEDDVIKEDDNPCIYFHKQEFKIMGVRHARMGFIALMRLEDDDEARIFPHENTHDEPKEDRFRLWSSLHSNLSPIFVGFSDKEKKVEGIFANRVAMEEPFIDLVDEDEVRHIVWRLDDPSSIKVVEETLFNQPLFIADGHHRYEVAKRYRQSRGKGKAKTNGEAPSNYVMTYFTNMSSKNMQVFPIHRVIKSLPDDLGFLEEYFRMDKIGSKEDLVLMLAKAGRNEHAIGLYSNNGIKLLRLKNRLLVNQHIQEGSEEFKTLDATILKHFVLDKVGVKSDDIIYSKDLQEATDMVDNGEADACFVMNPVKISQVRAIALNGERMPPKTTYFYPKVLSGLTVYKME